MKEEKPSKPEIVGTPEENAERLKKLGNDAFAAQQYPKAIQYYSEALGIRYLVLILYRFCQKRSDLDKSCCLIYLDQKIQRSPFRL
jgi:hypothetical protein